MTVSSMKPATKEVQANAQPFRALMCRHRRCEEGGWDRLAGERSELARSSSRTHLLPLRVEGVRLLVRVVRRPYERARFDVDEAAIECRFFERGELVGMVVADHTGVLRRWTQVLADCQDGHADVAQIVEDREDLVVLFAHADHDPGLRGNVRPIVP